MDKCFDLIKFDVFYTVFFAILPALFVYRYVAQGHAQWPPPKMATDYRTQSQKWTLSVNLHRKTH